MASRKLRSPDLSRLSLSAFMPCYNEQGNVERTTLAMLEACRSVSDDFEVIIVDDGSTDRTAQIAERLVREHPQVRWVRNWPNQGYGGALQRGFAEASKDWIFYTDGDGQFDPREIRLLVGLLKRYDIVSAYRLDRQEGLVRKLNAWAWSSLVNLLFGMHLRDIDCAFKIFPKRLFDQINVHSRGALIDAEVLARAKLAGYRIGQVGVHHYQRLVGEQTGANVGVIARAFWELIKLYGHIRFGRSRS